MNEPPGEKSGWVEELLGRVAKWAGWEGWDWDHDTWKALSLRKTLVNLCSGVLGPGQGDLLSAW